MGIDIRRLAAVDMYGPYGGPYRRWIITLEFVLGSVGGPALGLWAAGQGGGGRLFGWWLAGVGLNYLPLTVHAVTLLPAGRLERELAEVDVAAELRYYTTRQLWVFVPLLLLVVGIRQAGRGRRAPAG